MLLKRFIKYFLQIIGQSFSIIMIYLGQMPVMLIFMIYSQTFFQINSYFCGIKLFSAMGRYLPVLYFVLSVMSLRAADVPEAPVPLADPFILNEGGVYYAYGTFSSDGIVVLMSDDLKTWHWPEGQSGYLALDRKDSYGDKWFWAPEVYRTESGYLMYYSADEHICCAVSESPTGPFRQTAKRPMSDERGIDNSLFIDSDGRPYIFWVRIRGCNEIWMAELEQDLRTIKEGTERFCIRMSQDWEKVWPSVNEGPFVLKHDGKYYLTYSANSYESKLYGIGYAVSDSVTGPWEKYSGNPKIEISFHRPSCSKARMI